jgi:hypothetical protein
MTHQPNETTAATSLVDLINSNLGFPPEQRGVENLLEDMKPRSPRVSIYPGEDALHVHFDDYDDVWSVVTYKNFTGCLIAPTTEDESMNAISMLKKCIADYEKYNGRTHDEWLAEKEQINSGKGGAQ